MNDYHKSERTVLTKDFSYVKQITWLLFKKFCCQDLPKMTYVHANTWRTSVDITGSNFLNRWPININRSSYSWQKSWDSYCKNRVSYDLPKITYGHANTCRTSINIIGCNFSNKWAININRRSFFSQKMSAVWNKSWDSYFENCVS